MSVAAGRQAGQAGRLRPLPRAVRRRLGRDPHRGRRPPGPAQAAGRVPHPVRAARPVPADPGRGDHRPVREEADPHERQQPAGADQAPGRQERRRDDGQQPRRRRGAGPAAGPPDPGPPEPPQLRLRDHRRGAGDGHQGAVLRGLQRPPGVHHLGDETHAGVERMWDIINTLRIGEMGAAPVYGLATDDSHNYFGTGRLVAGPGLGHGACPVPDPGVGHQGDRGGGLLRLQRRDAEGGPLLARVEGAGTGDRAAGGRPVHDPVRRDAQGLRPGPEARQGQGRQAPAGDAAVLRRRGQGAGDGRGDARPRTG